MTLELNENAVTGFLEECYRQGFNEKQAAYLLERSLDTSDTLEKRALGPSQNANVDWGPLLQLIMMLAQKGDGGGMGDLLQQLIQASGSTPTSQTNAQQSYKPSNGTGYFGDYLANKKFYQAGDDLKNKPVQPQQAPFAQPSQQQQQQQPGTINISDMPVSTDIKPLPEINFGPNGGQLTLDGMNQPNLLNPNGNQGTLNIDMTGKGTMVPAPQRPQKPPQPQQPKPQPSQPQPNQQQQQQPGTINISDMPVSTDIKPLPEINFGPNGGQLTLDGMNQSSPLNPNGNQGTLNIDMTGKGTSSPTPNFSQPFNTGTHTSTASTPSAQPDKPTPSVPPQQPNNPTRATPSTQPGGAPQNGTPGGSNPPATAGGAPQNDTPGGGTSAPSGKPETVKYNYGDPVKNKFTTKAYGVTNHFLELPTGQRIQVDEHTYNGATTQGENGDLVKDPAGDKDRQLAQQLSKQLGENVEEAETGVVYGVPYTRAKVNGQWRDLSGRNYYTPGG